MLLGLALVIERVVFLVADDLISLRYVTQNRRDRDVCYWRLSNISTGDQRSLRIGPVGA